MSNNFLLLLPEFMVTGLAFVVLTLDFITSRDRKHWLGYVAAAGLTLTLVVMLAYQWNTTDSLYDGLISIDGYSLFFRSVFLVMGIVIILSSIEYVRRNLEYPGEYYAILVFAVVGMMLMSTSRELLTAYISLELLSFSLYVLVSFDRYNPKSNEGGAKYILLGAVSSALMLFGISQIFGLTGTTRFDEIASALTVAREISPGVLVGLVLIIAGLGFKVAAVPFHMWAPDAYEGAPIPITAFLAVASKAAAFALALRFFAESLLPVIADWQIVLAMLAALTMTVGNLVALAQTNLKRLLAYSSIAHVGYLLMGLAGLAAVESDGDVKRQVSHLASNGLMFHLVAYGVTNSAAFLCLAAFYNDTRRDDISDLAGLARRAPFLSLVLAAALFSLAGLPFFAGFVSKFYLFSAVAAQGLLWLAGLAIFTSLISLYYYLQVIRQMYIEKPTVTRAIRVPKMTVGLLAVLLIGMTLIGVYPAPVMDAIQYASEALFANIS